MKTFQRLEVREAMKYAAEGGQALHLFGPQDWTEKAPVCFRGKKVWGHLMDNNRDRLVETAGRLGVNKTVVGREGRPGQHVDLCGEPLRRALEQAKQDQMNEFLYGESGEDHYDGPEDGPGVN